MTSPFVASPPEAAARVHRAMEWARGPLVEREVLVELVALAAVAREHVLVIGPPGTAKSEAIRRAARAVEARYFEYLLGRFTEPSELFGPIDLRKLREGVVETETAGMLPEAEMAFLDEVFLGSTAILNTLLGILNERTFRRGRTELRVPLRLCVGAANALPEDESLSAFADRFLLRVFVEPVPDARLEDLLEAGASARDEDSFATRARVGDLDALGDAARVCELDAIRPLLADAVRLLRKAGVELSDRRVVKTQRLIAAAAALDGRAKATSADLWPIIYALPTPSAQSIGRHVLRERLSEANSEALAAAALDASGASAARAQKYIDYATSLLDRTPVESERESWSLRIEGALRDIDAAFAEAARSEPLSAIRARLIAALGEGGTS